MAPRYWLIALLVSLFVIGGSGRVSDIADTSERPDILLILTDDQRYDTLWAMPTVRRLQAKGVTFRNAIATNPLCCPSRASILTGNYSHTTGVMSNRGAHGGFEAFNDSYTIATELQASGYRTGLVGKYLNGYHGDGYTPPGWDVWEPYTTFSGEDLYRQFTTDELADMGVEFLSTHRDQPRFLYWASYAPHMPAIPLARHKGMFGRYRYPSRPSFNEKDVSDKPGYIRRQRRLSHRKQVWLRQRTERQLETLLGVDEAIARLLKAQAGRPTLVIFTSDNGYSFGEHRWTSKTVPYEESIRVPLVVAGLNLPAGTTVDSLVAGIDLAPTIASAAGVDFHAEGTPLDSVPPGRWLLLEHWAYGRKKGVNQVPSYCGVRTPTGMYVRYRGGFEEAYSLVKDPYQLDNRPATGHLRALARKACVRNLPFGMSWRRSRH
jgi:N-acetylglucosamine-6-sulfatase